MSNDSPATKGDLKQLVTKGEMDARFRQLAEEIKRHFDLTVESIRHDLKGANRDEIETMKDDVVRLKEHTGYVAA